LVLRRIFFYCNTVSLAKEFGGLGFMDVRVRNICCKWVNKLERGETCICCELLRRKYLDEKSILRKSGSQF